LISAIYTHIFITPLFDKHCRNAYHYPNFIRIGGADERENLRANQQRAEAGGPGGHENRHHRHRREPDTVLPGHGLRRRHRRRSIPIPHRRDIAFTQHAQHRPDDCHVCLACGYPGNELLRRENAGQQPKTARQTQ